MWSWGRFGVEWRKYLEQFWLRSGGSRISRGRTWRRVLRVSSSVRGRTFEALLSVRGRTCVDSCSNPGGRPEEVLLLGSSVNRTRFLVGLDVRARLGLPREGFCEPVALRDPRNQGGCVASASLKWQSAWLNSGAVRSLAKT